MRHNLYGFHNHHHFHLKGQTMTKREYFNTCRDMARTRRGREFLHGCLRNPSAWMRPIHLLIIRAAMRDVATLG